MKKQKVNPPKIPPKKMHDKWAIERSLERILIQVDGAKDETKRSNLKEAYSNYYRIYMHIELNQRYQAKYLEYIREEGL